MAKKSKDKKVKEKNPKADVSKKAKVKKIKPGKTRDALNKKRDRYFMLGTVILFIIVAISGYIIFDYLLSFVFSANKIDPVQVEMSKIKINVNKYESVLEDLDKLKLFTNQ